MGRRRLPYEEVFYVKLQNNQKRPLERVAAFGIVLMMLNRRFHGGRVQNIRL